MAERPILFSGPLVRAILEGRKTETRRLVTKSTSRMDGETRAAWDDLVWVDATLARLESSRDPALLVLDAGGRLHAVDARILPGDTLWVRETWRVDSRDVTTGRAVSITYAADEAAKRIVSRAAYDWVSANPDRRIGPHPSIHMPRWASRISLKVTDVRVERLHEITEGGAQREGVAALPSARNGFAALWDEINGKRPGARWDSNPWVWVIKFEVQGTSGAEEKRRQGGE